MKTYRKLLFISILLLPLLESCDMPSSESEKRTGSAIEEEFDSNTPIAEVQIGKNVWMKNNLNVNKYRNGESIRHAKTPQEWMDANKNGEGAWCYYNHEPKNAIYGKLYNYYAVIDARGLAPENWHVPSVREWATLDTILADASPSPYPPSYLNVGRKLRSASGWDNNGSGSDDVGFSAIPGGYVNRDGAFDWMGRYALWWTTNQNGPAAVNTILLDTYFNTDYQCFREYGCSVRCIKD